MASSNDLQIRKILIPYDFSETAALSLEHAVFMAKLLKAEIVLLHIIESVSFASALSQTFGSTEKKAEAEAIKKLEQLAKDIHMHHGVTLKIMTEFGKVYKRISAVAKDVEADIIVMGTHGESGYQKFNVGTNTSRVVERAPCPVISVQTHSKNLGFKKIVLPIDDSLTSRQKVNYALSVARNYNSQVIIVGLINFNSEDNKRKFRIKVEQVEEFLSAHEISCAVKYLEGDNLAKLTMQAGEESDADLLIIMTEQEPSITGFFLGTFATQVVNHSKIPVMSVHPLASDPDKISVGL